MPIKTVVLTVQYLSQALYLSDTTGRGEFFSVGFGLGTYVPSFPSRCQLEDPQKPSTEQNVFHFRLDSVLKIGFPKDRLQL